MTAATQAGTLDRFIKAKERKALIERELRAIEDELAPLEEELLAEFAAEGVDGKRHAQSGRLVSIRRQIWARPAIDRPAACQALKAHEDLAPYVEETFNTNSLSAYFREEAKRIAAEQGYPVTDLRQLLPEDLRDVIDLTQDHTLSVRA